MTAGFTLRRRTWLRSAWLVVGGVAAVWLALMMWLSRPPASWTTGWVGWWSGNDSGSHPAWHLQSTPHVGAAVQSVQGDPAYAIRQDSGVMLGYFRNYSAFNWTWSSWVRSDLTTAGWPEFLTVFRTMDSLRTPYGTGSSKGLDYQLKLGLARGRPTLLLDAPRHAGSPLRVSVNLTAEQVLQAGHWHHLAISLEWNRVNLFLDGQLVGTESMAMIQPPFLARLELGDPALWPDHPRTDPTAPILYCDETVLFLRTLASDEIRAFAAAGRGGWEREFRRGTVVPQMIRQSGHVLGGLVLLLTLFSTVAWLREQAFVLVGALRLPAYRWVLVTLVLGLLLTAVASVSLGIYGRRSDDVRFAELQNQLTLQTDRHWELVAGLLFRARDWISFQTNLTQKAWTNWLYDNHYPFEPLALVNVGYAEAVLPENVAAHEARWRERNGFDYRVLPAERPTNLIYLGELGGTLRLPIVVFGPDRPFPEFWATNGSILGRDLLVPPAGDLRPWNESRRVEQAVARCEIISSALEEIAPLGWYGVPVQGLRLYVPWSRNDPRPQLWQPSPPEDVHGVVFGSVDLKVLIADRLGNEDPLIGFRVFTGGREGVRYELVADAAEIVPAARKPQGRFLQASFSRPLYRYQLIFDVWTTEAFHARSPGRWVPFVAAAGLSFTAVLALLLFVQIRFREQQSSVLAALRNANEKLTARARERALLSRDLHDGSIQNLYALGLNLQRVQPLMLTAPVRAQEELAAGLHLLNQTVAELRRFIEASEDGADGAPPEPRTVATVIHSFAEQLRQTARCELRVEVDPRAAKLEPSSAVQLLNLVREAASNALRHSGTKELLIRLTPVGESPAGTDGESDDAVPWRLTVEDHGCGFDVAKVDGRGHGLGNLEARARELGGTLSLRSAPGAGTTVTVEFKA